MPAARSAALAAFVLHRYDWSETSLILDLFTREQGRVAVAAKGAKRPYSQLRPVLLPFQRLAISLGRTPADAAAEVQTLRQAEWAGGGPMLSGAALFSGFYLNELLMKLLARHDPHPALFDAYADSLGALAQGGDAEQAGLRAFELVLLRELGLLPDLARRCRWPRCTGCVPRPAWWCCAPATTSPGCAASSSSACRPHCSTAASPHCRPPACRRSPG
jgi:DNA repair protein RecO (recombination protein O)